MAVRTTKDLLGSRNPKGCPVPEGTPHRAAAPPAPLDAELREALDLVAHVLASFSDRVDAQAALIERLAMAAEAQQAIHVAHLQATGAAVQDAVLDAMEGPTARLATLEEPTRCLLNLVLTDRERARRRNRRWPFVAILALGVGLAVGLGAPRLLTVYALPCAVLGGVWA